MNESAESLSRPSVGILTQPTDEEVAQIVALERETFDWEVAEEDMEDLARTVQQPENIVGVIRSDKQEIVGYLVAVPATSADESIGENDVDFKPNETDLYIETFAIASKYRLIQTPNMVKTVVAEAARRGYAKVVAHVPENHARLYTTFGATAVRTIDEWYGSGEPHIFIEYRVAASAGE